jgi:hypothetical protein
LRPVEGKEEHRLMVTDQHSEIERKYDVPLDAMVPGLFSLPGVDRVAPPDEVELDAMYFDTADLALAGAGITLRRRTGGADAGWHLKLPVSADTRGEVRRPLEEGHGEPPAELLDCVRAFVRDHPVAPVMSLGNRRVVHRLLDADGATLAEVCDDQVSAHSRLDGAPPVQWREWEVELGDGTALLDSVEALLLEAGACPATSSSKLARALGGRLPGPAPRRGKKMRRNDSTGVLLTEYLTEQVSRLKQEDLRLRVGDAEGVHQMRIAARRLRSALATYRDVLAPGSAEGLRSELQWLGGVLAPARDAQVMRERLGGLVRLQPAELVLGAVAHRIDDELGARFRSGRSDAELALAGKRYFRLLDRLDAFTNAPPFSQAARQPVRPGGGCAGCCRPISSGSGRGIAQSSLLPRTSWISPTMRSARQRNGSATRPRPRGRCSASEPSDWGPGRNASNRCSADTRTRWSRVPPSARSGSARISTERTASPSADCTRSSRHGRPSSNGSTHPCWSGYSPAR